MYLIPCIGRLFCAGEAPRLMDMNAVEYWQIFIIVMIAIIFVIFFFQTKTLYAR